MSGVIALKVLPRLHSGGYEYSFEKERNLTMVAVVAVESLFLLSGSV